MDRRDGVGVKLERKGDGRTTRVVLLWALYIYNIKGVLLFRWSWAGVWREGCKTITLKGTKIE